MKRVLLATTILTAVGVTPAYATLQIAFSNGVSDFFCADQTACDLDGAVRNLLLINTTVGDVKIAGTFAEAGFAPNLLSVSNLTITNLSATKTETLSMAVGDTGFVAPVHAIRSSASLTFTNDHGGFGALSFFADPADTQPAAFATDLPGILQFAQSDTITTSPDSFAGTKDTVFNSSVPFSMAEGAVLRLAPGASITGFNEAMTTAAIPEPATWAMMLVGFVGLMWGALVRKRVREFY